MKQREQNQSLLFLPFYDTEMAAIPPPLTICAERDDSTVKRNSTHIQVAQILATDNAIEHYVSNLL